MYAGVLKSSLKGREVDWDNPGLVVKGIDKATRPAQHDARHGGGLLPQLVPIHEAAIFSTGFVKLREVRLGWDVPIVVASA